MVKRWVVKGGSHKATFLKKEPSQDQSEQNVIGTVKRGDLLTGEFLFVRRASLEAGFIKFKHLEHQCGMSWRVRNADGQSTTILQKQPQDLSDPANTVGFALEGELLEGEFLFVVRDNARKGGYVKVRHLKPVPMDEEPPQRQQLPSKPSQPAQLVSLPSKPSQAQQRWAVLDSDHDGAWLRKAPQADRSQQNVICLIANGSVVIGDYIYLQTSTSKGFLPYRSVQQIGPREWQLRSNASARDSILRRRPGAPEDKVENIAALITPGEHLTGEFILVSHKDGKYVGYVKKQYLVAQPMVTPPSQALLVVS